MHLVAWALQSKSELCLLVRNVTVCWAGNRAACGNHRETTEGVNRVISELLGTFLQEQHIP